MRPLLFTILFIFYTISSYSQGVINNNAYINLNGAVNLYVNGTTGNYTSQSGGLIIPSASSSITLIGNWNNNSANVGFTTDAGNVFLNGAAQSISGTNPTAFYNLTIAGTGIKTLAVSSTTVGGQSNFSGVLSVGNGTLDLNSNRINITNGASGAITSNASGYIISETNAAINPSIIRWYTRTNLGTYIYPFGAGGLKIPFTFNITSAMTGASDYIEVSTRATTANNNLPWAGASNVAAVTLMYSPNGPFLDGSDEVVIDRWWDISPSGTPTANITFSYRGIENTLSAPYNTGNLGAQYWTGTGWLLDNASYGSSIAVSGAGTVGTVTTGNVKDFCPWVLSAKLAPLPIELISFEANCNNNEIVLKWCTATEKNNKYFSIEQSGDGINFKEIGTIPGNGTTQDKHCYNFKVASTFGEINYFRLKQIDKDESFSYTKMISIESCDKKLDNIIITNTGSHFSNILINASSDFSFDLNIINALGQLIDVKRIEVNKGFNSIKLNLNYLANGIYYLNAETISQNLVSRKIVLSDLVD